MKERIFTTKEQGRVLVEAGLPISTAIGFRDKYLDQLHSMEDDAGRVGLIEAVTPDVFNPVWDVGTLLNLLPYEIDGSTFECYKLEHAWSVTYRDIDEIPIYWSSEKLFQFCNKVFVFLCLTPAIRISTGKCTLITDLHIS